MGVSMDFKIVSDNTEEIKEQARQQLLVALEAVGLQAEADVKRKTPTDTGRLKNSITHDVDTSDNTAIVGTNTEYAKYVEYGHTQEVGRYVPKIGKRLKNAYVEPKPFLKNTIQENLKKYKAIFEHFMKGIGD